MKEIYCHSLLFLEENAGDVILKESLRAKSQELVQSKPKFLLSTNKLEIISPTWQQVEGAIKSADILLHHQYCVLSIIDTNSFIQCATHKQRWRLEIRFIGGKSFFVYYGLKKNTIDDGLIDDRTLIIDAFRDFYDGVYRFKNIDWIEYRYQ